MNSKRSGASVSSPLLLLVAAASVGLKVFTAALLSIGVVLLYGAMLALLRYASANRAAAFTFACRAGAAVAAPLWFLAVAVWSSKVGLSFIEGLATWTIILAVGASWGRVATWRQHRAETVVHMSPGLSAC